MSKILMILSAIIVMVHCTCMIARLNYRNWFGRQLQFVGLTVSYSFIAGGSVGIALSWPPAAAVLLFGLAGWILFDRRMRT